WQFAAQAPDRDLWFGFGPAEEVKRKLLTFWNAVKFFVDYANIAGFTPPYAIQPPVAEPLDRWLLERTEAFAVDATAGYERRLASEVTASFEAYLDDLSNWYIRRSRRRFWDEDAAALHALWHALNVTVTVLAPIMPFLTDHLHRTLNPGG